MSAFRGFWAEIVTDAGPLEQLLDQGQEGVKNNFRTAISNFVPCEGGETFIVSFEAMGDMMFESPGFSFLLIVDGKAAKFFYIHTPDLPLEADLISFTDYDMKFKKSKPADLTFNDEGFGTVQLKIFRMMAHGTKNMMKPQYIHTFEPGQIIKGYGSKEELGTGDHWVVVRDTRTWMYEARFYDQLNKPWVEFTWKYRPQDVIDGFPVLPEPNLAHRPKKASKQNTKGAGAKKRRLSQTGLYDGENSEETLAEGLSALGVEN